MFQIEMEQEFGEARPKRSVENHPLRIGGASFLRSVGTRATSEMWIDLKGVAERFDSFVGLDDETNKQGGVEFEVWVDGRKAAASGIMRVGQPPKKLSADLHGAKWLVLFAGAIGRGSDHGHADWAGAMLTLAPDAKVKPETAGLPPGPRPDIIHPTPVAPAIHGPRIVGSTPGRPFLFTIPATGEKPLQFSAKGLPEGLALDAATGQITGALNREGKTRGSDGQKRLGPVHPDAHDHRRQTQTGADAADGLELLELLGQRRQRRQRPGRRRRDGRQRPGRPRFSIRQHRRLLGRPTHGQWRNPDKREVPRHEGPCRLCPRQRAETGHLFLARPEDLRRLRGELETRAAGRRFLREVGHRLPQVRLVLLRPDRAEAGSRRPDEALPRHARRPGPLPPRHRL